MPYETIERAVATLREKGHVARGYLGAGLHPVRDRDAHGAMVMSLDDNGPAKAAGLSLRRHHRGVERRGRAWSARPDPQAWTGQRRCFGDAWRCARRRTARCRADHRRKAAELRGLMESDTLTRLTRLGLIRLPDVAGGERRLVVLIALRDAARAERLSASLAMATICCRSWPAAGSPMSRIVDDDRCQQRGLGRSGEGWPSPPPQVLLSGAHGRKARCLPYCRLARMQL